MVESGQESAGSRVGGGGPLYIDVGVAARGHPQPGPQPSRCILSLECDGLASTSDGSISNALSGDLSLPLTLSSNFGS
jgi:hypothetical protein